jgi:hypothetical protein
MDYPEAILSQQASSVGGGDEMDLKMEVKSIKNEINNQLTIAKIFNQELPTQEISNEDNTGI